MPAFRGHYKNPIAPDDGAGIRNPGNGGFPADIDRVGGAPTQRSPLPVCDPRGILSPETWPRPRRTPFYRHFKADPLAFICVRLVGNRQKEVATLALSYHEPFHCPGAPGKGESQVLHSYGLELFLCHSLEFDSRLALQLGHKLILFQADFKQPTLGFIPIPTQVAFEQ